MNKRVIKVTQHVWTGVTNILYFLPILYLNAHLLSEYSLNHLLCATHHSGLCQEQNGTEQTKSLL